MKPIENVSQFLSAIKGDFNVRQLKDASTGAFFRGSSDGSLDLVPSLYRRANAVDLEREMVRAFINNSSHLVDKEPHNLIEWLFLMQHHGLPTRLLDWSESALIALFFAVESHEDEKSKSKDAVVWVLNPWLLNRASFRSIDILPSSNSSVMRGYEVDPFSDEINRRIKEKNPIAIRTRRNSQRSLNQKGMVTIHGSSQEALNSFCQKRKPKCLSAIPISAPHKRDIFYELIRSGITYEVIYPGLDGLSKAIIQQYLR